MQQRPACWRRWPPAPRALTFRSLSSSLFLRASASARYLLSNLSPPAPSAPSVFHLPPPRAPPSGTRVCVARAAGRGCVALSCPALPARHTSTPALCFQAAPSFGRATLLCFSLLFQYQRACLGAARRRPLSQRPPLSAPPTHRPPGSAPSRPITPPPSPGAPHLAPSPLPLSQAASLGVWGAPAGGGAGRTGAPLLCKGSSHHTLCFSFPSPLSPSLFLPSSSLPARVKFVFFHTCCLAFIRQRRRRHRHCHRRRCHRRRCRRRPPRRPPRRPRRRPCPCARGAWSAAPWPPRAAASLALRSAQSRRRRRRRFVVGVCVSKWGFGM